MRAAPDLPPATPPQMDQHLKYAADTAAAGAAFASFAGWFQPLVAIIASMLSIVWLTMQIVDWWLKRKGNRT